MPEEKKPTFQVPTKILLVEDDKFFAGLLAKKISASGAVLIHAPNGEEALKAVENENPSLILLDILLPGIDGLQVLAKLKSDEKTKNIPVIILSNFGSEDQIKTGQKLGVATYLIKATITPDEVLKEIQATLIK